MTATFKSLLPCVPQRRQILESFSEREQKILERFRTKFIIRTNRIKVVKAITTQNGDPLFVATMKTAGRTKQVALQQIVLTESDGDKNLKQLARLFRRRRHLHGKCKNFLEPLGLTVMRYINYDALCIVIKWPSNMQCQSLSSYMQRTQTSVPTQMQLINDILVGVKHIIDRKIPLSGLNTKHLFIDDGLNVKIAYYGLSTNKHDKGDAIVGPNETTETQLVRRVGGLIAMVNSGMQTSPFRALKIACLEEDPQLRPDFEDLLREFETIFRHKKCKPQPDVGKKGMKKQEFMRLNSNVVIRTGESFDYDTDSTGIHL
jgi:hypothetical protein